MNLSEHINVKLNTYPEYITVPCAYDSGISSFHIHGIERTAFCKSKQADIFALIYNYFFLNTKITSENIPKFVKEKKLCDKLDYQHIFEMMIVLLLLIRNNICDDTIGLTCDISEDYIINVADIINHYGMIFGRLIGNVAKELNHQKLCDRKIC